VSASRLPTSLLACCVLACIRPWTGGTGGSLARPPLVLPPPWCPGAHLCSIQFNNRRLQQQASLAHIPVWLATTVSPCHLPVEQVCLGLKPTQHTRSGFISLISLLYLALYMAPTYMVLTHAYSEHLSWRGNYSHLLKLSDHHANSDRPKKEKLELILAQ
jgi:hypothetical protein